MARTAARSALLSLGLLHALREELGDILEPGGVRRADGHQRLMGLKAGAGHFRLARVRGRALHGLGWRRRSEGALGNLEEVQNAERFEQLSNARAGVEQLDAVAAVVPIAAAELEPEPGQDARGRCCPSAHTRKGRARSSRSPFGGAHPRGLLKSTLEVKLARPIIRMQANCSPTMTSILAEGVLMLGQCAEFRDAVERVLADSAPVRGLAFPTICTRVCCRTSDSSRLLETSRRLHWNSRSIARINSASL